MDPQEAYDKFGDAVAKAASVAIRTNRVTRREDLEQEGLVWLLSHLKDVDRWMAAGNGDHAIRNLVYVSARRAMQHAANAEWAEARPVTHFSDKPIEDWPHCTRVSMTGRDPADRVMPARKSDEIFDGSVGDELDRQLGCRPPWETDGDPIDFLYDHDHRTISSELARRAWDALSEGDRQLDWDIRVRQISLAEAGRQRGIRRQSVAGRLRRIGHRQQVILAASATPWAWAGQLADNAATQG